MNWRGESFRYFLKDVTEGLVLGGKEDSWCIMAERDQENICESCEFHGWKRGHDRA